VGKSVVMMEICAVMLLIQWKTVLLLSMCF